MKWNLRITIEAIIVAVASLCIFYSWPIVQGMLLTNNHVPDIVANYESVDYLQSSVAFGSVNGQGWGFMFICSILVAAAYYGLRSGLVYVKQRNRSKP